MAANFATRTFRMTAPEHSPASKPKVIMLIQSNMVIRQTIALDCGSVNSIFLPSANESNSSSSLEDLLTSSAKLELNINRNLLLEESDKTVEINSWDEDVKRMCSDHTPVFLSSDFSRVMDPFESEDHPHDADKSWLFPYEDNIQQETRLEDIDTLLFETTASSKAYTSEKHKETPETELGKSPDLSLISPHKGSLILCDELGNETLIGKMDLEIPVFVNPYANHVAVVKTIEKEWNKYSIPRPNYSRHDSELAWRPLSVFSAYTNVKVPHHVLQDIPRSSCFGKINMRCKRAWFRSPNKRRRLR